MLLAGTLITASFLSAYFISASANHSALYWSARTDLVSGHQLRADDIEPLAVLLNRSADIYMPAKSQPIGSLIVRGIKKGELLPRASLALHRQLTDFVSLPISVLKSDIPSNVREGELVNVYQVGEPNLVSSTIAPLLVLSKVGVLGIDKSGSNMGGSQTFTLSVKAIEVLNILKATSAGRLVIVRVNG